ncbi:alkyl hydroperoxide reductase/ Thiol specific antioxidant/ Mal allergen [[Leptolyngbya] sp. PCC 7376]|uniref:peroxiredoxin-like family protein n=1 Tax=[Leptolyngbya] sp. PCC 7376 TaxID=111781 RepID=UPI00029F2468|nr:peroxiredoxin-like family protein [[Leptolyngbya] sp. PCC 7376]AFY39068.1 alkyl hydroperoxide reductase/ Thiol specific antioxidant/ Mal allergen [[Leptolyngbya] sp. PCC 7376]
MSAIALDSLQDQISQFMESFRANVPEEVQALMAEKTAELRAQHLVEKALKVGDRIPDFKLPDATGKTVKLSELLQSGSVVINFYRGGWCPYCNLELRALQQALPEFQKRGAQLVAISPETPDNSLSTQEKNELEFPVLSDVDNVVAKKLGLVFELSEALRPIYKGFGIDVATHNGNEKYELPMPATYVIDSTGIIRYAFVDEDYTKRAEPSDIIAAIAKL